MKTKTMLAMLSLALGGAIALPAGAQEVLPRPPQPFKGKIDRTAAELGYATLEYVTATYGELFEEYRTRNRQSGVHMLFPGDAKRDSGER